MSVSFERFEHDGLHAYMHTAYEDRTEDQVYVDLIWKLSDGLERYAIPRYHRDSGVSGWGEPYALVDWEYELDVEEHRDPPLASIRGFVPARSAVAHPVIGGDSLFAPVLGPPSPYAADNANKAGLFAARSAGTLAEVVRELRRDASSELNLFAMAEGPTRLFKALTAEEPPRLADLLGPADVFVDLVIGIDMGYSSAVLIQAHSDLSAKLEEAMRNG